MGQTSRSLKLNFQEHKQYIKHNEPQSAHALHIFNCKHDHGTFGDTVTLLNHIDKTSLLLPYEQLQLPLGPYNKQLIPEQNPKEQNPIFKIL